MTDTSDPVTTAAEALAEAENDWADAYSELGGPPPGANVYGCMVDALLAHAPADSDGIRRVVLEGRSGQDATIRGLRAEVVRCDDGSTYVLPPDESPLPDDVVLYRLIDPSTPDPEEAS